jgi:hypothetical protein
VGFRYRFLAICGLTTDLNVQAGGQNGAYTLANGFMIIGNEDAHLARISRVHAVEKLIHESCVWQGRLGGRDK